MNRLRTTLITFLAVLILSPTCCRVWAPPPASAAGSDAVKVKLLAINDFHGQIGAGRKVSNRPVGSAPVLAAYLKNAQSGAEKHTFIVHAGDFVGASPPSSALLQDEPSIMFFNLLANKHCSYDWRNNPRCNLVATVGNHEFDEGKSELRRLILGGNHPSGPFLEDPWRGARFPYVSASVVKSQTGMPLLRPYIVKEVKGEIPIAFVGAVIKDTPSMVTPTGVEDTVFVDEAEAVNFYARLLSGQQVKAIVAIIHEGGTQAGYTGPTNPDAPSPTGKIAEIVSRLDDEVDVVISAHSHGFTNALMKNANNKPILVTQAYSAGTAFANIDLEIDPVSRDIITKSAQIMTTYADEGPGLTPDPAVAALVQQAEDAVGPLVNQVVGTAAQDLLRTANDAGESALGNLIADAQKNGLQADMAFMNPGGIRADLAAGEVTWGELFTVQPFNNYLVRMQLSGQQIYDLLNQQWLNQPYSRILQISGLSYTWDNNLPVGDRIVEVIRNGAPIDKAAVFTVTVNSFLAAGGDNFTVLTQGLNPQVGPVDLDALITHIKALPQPFSAAIEGRIARLN